MANIKISDLTAAAAATGTQQFEVNDSLTSKKVTGAQVLAYIESNLTIQNNAVTTAKIADNNVTLAKLEDIATASILGRNTAGTGDPEVLSGATARTIIGANNASNLTTGTVGTARLASGTANSTTYLRGDQTWATVTSLPGAQAQVFTGSGTFTIPTGVTAVKVTVVGGGGGGGGVNAPACTTSCGGGGGGGGTAIKYLTSLTPGNTLTVTVGAAGTGGAAGANNGGAGGNSSVASGTQTITTITANGGSGGLGTTGNASGVTGGSASNGDINMPGQNTSRAVDAGTARGGDSLFGFGGVRTTTVAGSTAGTGYGGGGSGAVENSATRAGAAGTAGIVIIEW